MRFTEIREEVRDSRGFRNLKDTSIRKQLSRALVYLIDDTKIAMKCERRTVKSVAGTYYFRFFKFEEIKEGCRDCWVLRKVLEELERLIEKLRKLTENKN